MGIKLWALESIVVNCNRIASKLATRCTQPPITAHLWYHSQIQQNGADQTNFQASQPLIDWLIVFISKMHKKVNKTKQLT